MWLLGTIWLDSLQSSINITLTQNIDTYGHTQNSKDANINTFKMSKSLQNRTIMFEFYYLLLCVQKCFEDLNIIHTMSYGAMLGAIRHGSIIPWDEDIDINVANYKNINKIYIYLGKYFQNYTNYQSIYQELWKNYATYNVSINHLLPTPELKAFLFINEDRKIYFKVAFQNNKDIYHINNNLKHFKQSFPLNWNFPFIDIFFTNLNDGGFHLDSKIFGRTWVDPNGDADNDANYQHHSTTEWDNIRFTPLILGNSNICTSVSVATIYANLDCLRVIVPILLSSHCIENKKNKLDVCQSPSWDHEKEIEIPKQSIQRIKCSNLQNTYNFIQYVYNDKQTETYLLYHCITHMLIQNVTYQRKFNIKTQECLETMYLHTIGYAPMVKKYKLRGKKSSRACQMVNKNFCTNLL